MATTKRYLVSFSVVHIALSLTVCCSGTWVGISVHERKESGLWPYATDGLFSTGVKAFVEDQRKRVLGLSPATNISAHFQLNLPETNLLLESGVVSFPVLQEYLLSVPPNVAVTSLVLGGAKELRALLLPVLWSIQTTVRTSKPDWDVKVAPAFSLPHLKTMCRDNDKDLIGVVDFLTSGSFLVIDIAADEKLEFGDELLHESVQKGISEIELLCSLDVQIVIKIKVFAVWGAFDLGMVADYAEKLIESLDHHSASRLEIYGIFVEVLPHGKLYQRDADLIEKHMVPHLHRELLNHKEMSVKMTGHDLTYPVTNPVTTPITVPATNPAPGVVTIPATNPVTVLPTNPFMPAVIVPPANPVTTPVTVPSTDPFAPVTIPGSSMPPPAVIPVTNPVTTPSTLPLIPVNNPVTTYPFPPPAVIPGGGTVPGTIPIPSTGSGQTWCVARTGAPDAALQVAIDYACGIGGADCLTIQETGACYNPNTLRDHASYAFNSYYQKNPTPSSCDFGGTAMIVNANPSLGNCVYPASSSSSLTPNTYPAGGSTTVFGSANPLGSATPASATPIIAGRPTATATSNSLSQPVSSSLLLTLIMTLLHLLNSSGIWTIV